VKVLYIERRLYCM